MADLVISSTYYLGEIVDNVVVLQSIIIVNKESIDIIWNWQRLNVDLILAESTAPAISNFSTFYLLLMCGLLTMEQILLTNHKEDLILAVSICIRDPTIQPKNGTAGVVTFKIWTGAIRSETLNIVMQW